MKRSEMLNRIEDTLESYFGSYYGIEYDELALSILRTIELNGMLPPTVPKGSLWYKFKSESDGIVSHSKLGRDVNEWEPEDE